MMSEQATNHGKQAIIQGVLSYTLVRQLLIVGIVAIIILLTVWWRYSSQLSQVSPTPAPAAKSSSLSPLPLKTTPITDVQVSGQQTTPSATTTHLEVNGQTVPVPTNGTTRQTVESPDGNTSVNLSVESTSSGSKNTSSSTHIQMNSSSHTQVTTNERTKP